MFRLLANAAFPNFRANPSNRCFVHTYAAAGLGVDIDNLLVSQPDSGEMALDIVDKLVRSAAVDVIVVDSVAALVPR